MGLAALLGVVVVGCLFNGSCGPVGSRGSGSSFWSGFGFGGSGESNGSGWHTQGAADDCSKSGDSLGTPRTAARVIAHFVSRQSSKLCVLIHRPDS